MGQVDWLLMERKVATEVRSVEGREVTGFPSVIGNVDDGGDLIEPGAYLKTLQERGGRLRWLWQHDHGQPPTARILEIAEVGRAELPEAVLARFPEAMGGLRVKREYLDTPRGNEVLAAIRSEALSELSIGYDAIQPEPGNGKTVAGRPVRRVLKEIRLWELSDVNWGMNAATTNVKGLLAAGDEKSLAQWLESRIHLSFTEVVDDLFGYGHLTRGERMALSNAIGLALDAFNQRMLGEDLAGVRGREQYEAAPVDGSVGDRPEPGAEGQGSGGAAGAVRLGMMRRRLAVLGKQLELGNG